jgi:ribosomal protein S18 acetylase RimI-like enzyme
VKQTIRRFVTRDIPGLIATINAICAEGRWMRTLRYEPTPAWEHALNDPGCLDHLLLVAEGGPQIVGWCRTFPMRCKVGDMTTSLGIGLLPDYRDRGIGSALVRTSLAWARDADLTRITLTTQLDNQRAMHVFRRCGFAPSTNGHNGTIKMAIELREKSYANL